jgi:hypothetical protein
MKALPLIALLALNASPASAADFQKFQQTVLSHWSIGPGEWADLNKHERCNEAEQAYARIGAQDRAIQDCEAAPGVRECLVKSSRITVNGPISDDVLQKYGIDPRNQGLYSPYGCEASALVYGIRD